MALTQQEIDDYKDQLRQQIEHLPPDKKAEAEKQIDAMPPEQLEILLKQQQEMPPVYRKIIAKEIPAVIIGENAEALAVLDNKPISRGHVVIIPKVAVKIPQEIPKTAFVLAEELTKKIVSSLGAKSAKAHTETKFGEVVLNLIPIYDKDLDISSPRQESNAEELNKVKSSFDVIKIDKKPAEIIKIEKRKEKVIKLKRRIP
ncbi:HIT domain-containing protein [Candidatus Pacearchaeota archaeon]|nr:HIT domain-containing protein [Candidatus Pacearchaeota archaeon]